ncbi:hypothetical protein A8L34_22515 [Bacillus sp. FJAT-27264]|uniref:phage major tail tube protein n=1 Tax=Paenibacillus sp. (strain DSM 101736 / FJAT-27264) TaxID=1850362 RepID=UPI000807CCE0|nr:phage major tail tube protein [Bacillus sp. FJAT-27264]OBZ08928.1 hypothetical protein A8L34_22515 [Bacillus sp. FJAT-27264]
MTVRSEQVIGYSVFLNGTDYLGTSTADLPEVAFLSETIKGGGIAGEVEAPSPGQTSAMTLTLNWKTTERASIQLLAPKVHALDLRASIQKFDTNTNEYKESALKITVRGRPLSGTLGGLEASATMDSASAFSVIYIKILIDGEEVVEIDKFNYIFKVLGVDYLATTRANLGL